MRIADITTKIIQEGGSMPGVGAIHISEIEPTLSALEQTLGLDLQNNALGSVGKREFSGDIDVAIQLDAEQIPEFIQRLEQTPEILDVKKSSIIMTKVKIQGYNPDIPTERERTGYVQVDFMPGDPDWMKVYYHSPRESESRYKGVYRNIMIATIAAVYDRVDSEDEVEPDRPAWSERYMWSPSDGLVRIRREPVPKKSGTGYTKKNKNTIIDGPWKKPDAIAQQLGLDSAADLNSFESLKAAIERNYPPEQVEKIFTGFAQNGQIQALGVPEEIQ